MRPDFLSAQLHSNEMEEPAETPQPTTVTTKLLYWGVEINSKRGKHDFHLPYCRKSRICMAKSIHLPPQEAIGSSLPELDAFSHAKLQCKTSHCVLDPASLFRNNQSKQ